MIFNRILFFSFYLLSSFQAFSADEDKCRKAVNALSETDKEWPVADDHSRLALLVSPVHTLK